MAIRFFYQAIYPDDRSETPVSIFVTELNPAGPTRAVLWSHRDEAWVFDPRPVAYVTYDPEREIVTKDLTRPEAEQVAAEVLGVPPIPTEEQLHRMNDEGEAERRRIRGEDTLGQVERIDP